MAIAIAKRYMPAEYLALEEKADFRSEFIEGHIIAMAGATANHNILAGKFYARLLLALEDLDYLVFMSDMRLWLPLYESYTYPDVMVVAGEPKFTDNQQTAITNPCLIVEVLSNSTGGYDKSAKFRLYRSIPEFEEYILIDQDALRVEQFTKVDDRQWLLTELMGEKAVLAIQSIAIEMSLKDLYKRVTFQETSEDAK
ncbi:Uma2 family endonuclease [Synechococcus sp. PCC 7336]|uniref:Uma2 family endonuclease n=1 Tax=Synechococcus sp. PCC 7336 TaxID=195250 RepID=UPI00034D3222|nr:Uma2 family endonuclease [Synechococcus sp. PCC 7336]